MSIVDRSLPSDLRCSACEPPNNISRLKEQLAFHRQTRSLSLVAQRLEISQGMIVLSHIPNLNRITIDRQRPQYADRRSGMPAPSSPETYSSNFDPRLGWHPRRSSQTQTFCRVVACLPPLANVRSAPRPSRAFASQGDECPKPDGASRRMDPGEGDNTHEPNIRNSRTATRFIRPGGK